LMIMRAFVLVFALLAGALLTAAILAYPAWLLVGLIAQQPIHRVLHRIAMLIALVGLIYLWRRYGSADKPSLGYALPRREFSRQLLIGLGLGAAVITPLMVMLFVLDVRVARGLEMGALIKLLLAGLASGLLVALIEETFFRGALFTAVRRESGAVLAVVLPSLLYASVHFLGGRLRIPAEQIEWSSGFAVLSEMFVKYKDPAALMDSFLALFFVGVLLALARLRTGAIAVCIGMHAAWVCAIAVVRGSSRVNPDAAASWLVGSYDGIIGWGVVGIMLAMAIAYFAIARGKFKPVAAS
jgi:uncharacterized protein